jgi:hypothetical protein
MPAGPPCSLLMTKPRMAFRIWRFRHEPEVAQSLRSRPRRYPLMHAPFKRQVERQMAPGDGLFSSRLPKFESYQPGILNSPCRHAVHTCAPTMPGKILAAAARWQRRSSNANRLCCAISAKSAENSPGNTRGFRSQWIPQFESYHPSQPVWSLRCHFRAWKNARQ